MKLPGFKYRCFVAWKYAIESTFYASAIAIFYYEHNVEIPNKQQLIINKDFFAVLEMNWKEIFIFVNIWIHNTYIYSS